LTRLADAVEDLTPEWFTEVLRVGGTIDTDVTVTSATSGLIGTGQFGMVVQTELEYDSATAGPASLIAKLPSRDAGSRQLGVMMGAYEAEVRFYQEIAPLVAVDVPHMHFGDIEPGTGRFTLVIDNLAPGSTVGDMVAGCSLDQAELAVLELVGLQAPSWDSPALLDKKWLSDIARTQMLFDIVPTAIDPFLERFAPRLEPEHIKLLRKLGPKASAYPSVAWKGPFVVAHGDYRLDNLMFGNSASAPPISIIDWQVARLAPPLLDAATFLGSCMSPDDRQGHEKELIGRYHGGLVKAGVTGFDLEDCFQSYRRSSLYTLLLGVLAAMTLEHTERGDDMWARMIRGNADLILVTGASDILD
jgi:Ecdysteroid kinase-like family